MYIDCGYTALFDAALFVRPKEIELLLDAGVDPNTSTTDGGGVTPLEWAIEHNVRKVIKVLIDRGARQENNSFN